MYKRQEQTAKTSIKTTKEAAIIAQKTAKTTAKATQKAARTAKKAAKATADTVKATAKATVATVKAIIAGTKEMCIRDRYMYTALAPIPLSTFAGEPTQNVGKSFIKSYYYGRYCKVFHRKVE